MNKKCIIGVDIGGTKISVTLGSLQGKILVKEKFPTENSWEKVIEKIYQTINSFLCDIHKDDVKAIGISCGGPLDSRKGVILSPPNLPGWDEVPVCSILEKKTGLPCFLENDANACALAEWLWGAGKGTQNMIFLTFGTGLGAGLILNGMLYEGTSGMAGEVGHLRIAEDGPLGYGKKGSWEGYCSGGGLSGHFSQVYGDVKTGKEICRLATEGDEKAMDIIDITARALGRGIALLLDILNPQRVIIGSIFTRDEALFREKMEQIIRLEALSITAKDCQVLPVALGESLGDMAALGVAAKGLQKKGKRPESQSLNLNKVIQLYLNELISRYPVLEDCRQDIEKAVWALTESFEDGGKILICGNGGSAADSDHIVGELMKGFVHSRPLSREQKEELTRTGGEKGRQMGERLQQGIPAISLCSPTALNTAFQNDVDPSLLYAQQVMALGNKGDILWGLSTSGNSSNVVAAVIAARAKGMITLAMTGEKKSQLHDLCDICIRVQGKETYKIQELHLPIYHSICLILEEYLFNKGTE
ncbi:ROK family protein [Oceanispirochaeta sp.]|jgi:glucokinase|uniref:ROK family protein n=1 Tax=Oceanispirochaeta sp. TaxID=2035350 RepID=UPI002639B387|nr:ROK family protein [Oceanispirochaeta sp.]MDA3958076.1 ROK family protein [Oceanispirochaeta sp.]